MPEKPWNHVVLGDGCRATLIPCGAWLTRRAADGHLSCNHSDSVECVVLNHETHTLYRVEVNKWDRVGRAVHAAVKAGEAEIGASDELRSL